MSETGLEIVPNDPIVDLNPPRNPGETPAPPNPPEPEKPAAETPQPEPEKPQPSPFNVRIGELTRQREDAKRERDAERARVTELEARLQALQTNQPAPAPAPTPAASPLPAGVTQADIDRLATQRAQQIVQQQTAAQAETARQEAWNNTIKSGQEKYTPAAFDAACNDLSNLGAGDNRAFLEAVQSADNGAAILHHLGTHHDEAARILALSPTKMAMEVARLETKISAPTPKQVSKAPPPITPIGGASSPSDDIYDPSLTSAQFGERRAKQIKARG